MYIFQKYFRKDQYENISVKTDKRTITTYSHKNRINSSSKLLMEKAI